MGVIHSSCFFGAFPHQMTRKAKSVGRLDSVGQGLAFQLEPPESGRSERDRDYRGSGSNSSEGEDGNGSRKVGRRPEKERPHLFPTNATSYVIYKAAVKYFYVAGEPPPFRSLSPEPP